MAEEGWTDNEIAKLTIKEYLKDFGKLDALVLGCTHFPLYEKIIKEYLTNTEIINTGKIVAEELFLKNGISENTQTIIEDEFYLTDTECNFIDVTYKILGKKINIKELK